MTAGREVKQQWRIPQWRRDVSVEKVTEKTAGGRRRG